MKNLFRYFNSLLKVISLTGVLNIRYSLSLRQVEDILYERGVDICRETVRLHWPSGDNSRHKASIMHEFGDWFALD